MSIYNKLFDWQKRLVDKYKDKRSYGLFLDMGLGKTPISLGFAEVNNCTKVLIITINSKATEDDDVSGSWFWWAKQSSMNYSLNPKTTQSFVMKSHDIFITNYESTFSRRKNRHAKIELNENMLEFIESCRFNNVAIIIDESHKLKDIQSMQTKAVNMIIRQIKLRADKTYLYLLTGTPFTVGYIDLYSQLKMLGYDCNKSDFVDSFCIRGQIPGLLGWQQPIIGYKNVDKLYDILHQYAITVQTEDVINLPEKVFIEHKTKMSQDMVMFVRERITEKELSMTLKRHNSVVNENELEHYRINNNRYKNPFFRNIAFPSSDWCADTNGTFWLRARELSIGFQGNAENAIWYDRRRLEQIKTFLSEYPDNYVIFYNYMPELLELYDICDKLSYNVDVYCGPIKSLHYYDMYEQQSTDERINNNKNVIIANFASGSTGKNWQLYNHAIISSLPLYKDWAQGLKRIHRTGQTKTVFYHIFSQDNWLDNSMMKALNEQIDYSEEMFGSDLQRVQQLYD